MQVADGQPDDRSLVQLTCDGPGQRQHLGEFKELKVLLPAPRTSRIARFLFAQVLKTRKQTRKCVTSDGKLEENRQK